MAAPSASAPLPQAEGSRAGREFLTHFARPREDVAPRLALLVDSPSPELQPFLFPNSDDPKTRTLPRTICQGGGDCAWQSDAKRSKGRGCH